MRRAGSTWLGVKAVTYRHRLGGGTNISPYSAVFTVRANSPLGPSLKGCAAKSVQQGVRVSVIMPGVVLSEFQDVAGYNRKTFGKGVAQFGKLLEPQAIANSICRLLSLPSHINVNEIMIRPTRPALSVRSADPRNLTCPLPKSRTRGTPLAAKRAGYEFREAMFEAKPVQVCKGGFGNSCFSGKSAGWFEKQVKQVHGRSDRIEAIHASGAIGDQGLPRLPAFCGTSTGP